MRHTIIIAGMSAAFGFIAGEAWITTGHTGPVQTACKMVETKLPGHGRCGEVLPGHVLTTTAMPPAVSGEFGAASDATGSVFDGTHVFSRNDPAKP